MATESTPLIQVVRVASPRQRYTHGTTRRFCTIALATSLIIILILFLVPVRWLWSPNWHRGHSSTRPPQLWPSESKVSYKELTKILLDTPTQQSAREWSKYYTSGPHLAGKNLSQATRTRDLWQDFGVENSQVIAYDIYINYPKSHRLALVELQSVIYECSLEEDVIDEDETTGLPDRIPTFHGYSASGNVTAQYVYVNFGTYEDFEDLLRAKVELKGKIALAKYGRIFRGLKVKRAQELGMVGTVLYTDPQEDGEITDENGYKTYPDGPARNPSSVQRGSVNFMSIAPGDPTTPGYPSLPGAPRQDPKGSTPSIPSLPISYQDAIPLLKALNGHGPKASKFNEYWQGGGLGYKGVDYNIGPSPANVVLNLVNEQEYVTTPLWNVIGIINGSISQEAVVVGNHRDAWIAGGGADPNSGSAALNEMVRSFGIALERGWKPLRTIIFASWDGEEYGLIGSTEWVEQYLPWLSASAVAYLNVDVATRGDLFSVSASPLLNEAINEATSLVPSPNQTVKGQTVRDVWDGYIRTMGSGSDFTAFQDFAGIPSVDLGFTRASGGASYHYHSNYDSFHWMEKYGDPGFHYHVAATKVWSLLAAKLVETPILALNTTDYARELAVYLEHATDRAGSIRPAESHPFRDVEMAIARLLNQTIQFDDRAAKLADKIGQPVPWWKWWKKIELLAQAFEINIKYKYFERQFLHADGLDSRPWFKHVVFAPGLWTGYSGATFPGLIEAIDERNTSAIERWSLIIEGNIDAATALLKSD